MPTKATNLPGTPPFDVVVRDAVHVIAFILLTVLMLSIRAEVRTLSLAIDRHGERHDQTARTLAQMEGRVATIEQLVTSLAGSHDGR